MNKAKVFKCPCCKANLAMAKRSVKKRNPRYSGMTPKCPKCGNTGSKGKISDVSGTPFMSCRACGYKGVASKFFKIGPAT